MKKTIPKKEIGKFLLLWCAVMLVSAWMLQWKVMQDANNLVFDPLSTGVERSDIVIVGIDDSSLQKIGAWPWNRDVHARLVQALGQYAPRAVGFDVLFAEARAGDIEMQEALDRAPYRVVLASKIEPLGYVKSVYALHNKNVIEGVVNVNPDSDAKVRVTQKYFLNKSACVPSFAEALIAAQVQNNQTACDTKENVLRYQENIPRVSYIDVLDGRVPLDVLKDKIVLVGFATTDLETDSFFGLLGTKINGVEIHAHAIATTLNNSQVIEISRTRVLLVNLLLALLLALIPFILRRVWLQLGIFVGVITLTFLAAIFAYEFGYKTYIPWAIGLPTISYAVALLYSYIMNVRKGEYLKKLFGTYVHPSLLDQLIANPKTLKLGGEKRHMTVLFSDVRGFTTFSEKLSPEALVDLLNDYLNVMSPVILDKRGTIDKYIGDAIMAFWNAPVLTKNHELLAVESALIMQEKLIEFNRSLNRADGMQLGIGIGVNSGEMVVGNMGSDARFNYTVMGDAVNTGSRFEGLTKKYGVITIVGEMTRNAITDDNILFRKLDVMTVKGKTEPTTIYEPLRASDSMKMFVEKYSQGFSAYEKGDFVTAKQILEPLVMTGDAPSIMLIERMRTIDLATWTGAWKWDEK